MSEIIPIPSGKSLSPLQLKLQARLAEIKRTKDALKPTSLATASAQLAQESEQISNEEGRILEVVSTTHSVPSGATDKYGHAITYNIRQQEAINLISSGRSCVVIGAAGTGKTTIQKGSTAALILSGLVQPLESSYDHKHLKAGQPGIAICAYTRRATNNIRRNLSEDLQQCCLTIHKLLEYEPVEYYVTDAEGRERKTMRFEPTRNAENPLPSSLKTIIIEESSMVSYELFAELRAACPHNPQYVFLGDIQQLPPVFGSAILGFKMLELPVVELTEVYRQALESPILSLAHRILSGKPIICGTKEIKNEKPSKVDKHGNTVYKTVTTSIPDFGPQFNVPAKLTLHPWHKKISAENATETLAKFFIKSIDQGKYNPETDGILIPFNKSCGTDELNKHLATKLAQRAFRPVFEIIHGWKRSYYSVGDKVLFEREDGVIEDIYENPQYVGIKPREASLDMNYWGHGAAQADADDIDGFLESVAVGEDDGDKKQRAASHIIKLKLLDSERIVHVKSAGEVDALILGYAITVHKSQGSEWAKVYLCFHHTHATMIQRELLYTAVTRAKEELFCICEPDTFEKGINRQRIKGSSWQEKAEYFKGKIENGDLQS